MLGTMTHVLAMGATNPVPARAQMATTLGFHIILACFGIAFADRRADRGVDRPRPGDAVAMLLARRWSKVMGVLVAVGAVTGHRAVVRDGAAVARADAAATGRCSACRSRSRGSSSSSRPSSPGSTCTGWRRLPPAGPTGGPACRSWSSGHLRRDLGDRGERVDEPAGRVHAHGRQDQLAVDPWQVFFNRRPSTRRRT